MNKKYFKYILFSFFVFFVFITNTNATSCQYDIPVNGKHLYIRYEYSGSWNDSSKIYCCVSDSTSNTTCNTSCGSNTIDFSTHQVDGVNITMPGSGLSSTFSGDSCPAITNTTEGSDVSIYKAGTDKGDGKIYDTIQPNSSTPSSPTVNESRRLIGGVQLIAKKDANGNEVITADGNQCTFVDLDVSKSTSSLIDKINTAEGLKAYLELAVANAAVKTVTGGKICVIDSRAKDKIFNESENLYNIATGDYIFISEYQSLEEAIKELSSNVVVNPGEEDKNEAEYKQLSTICSKDKGDERVKIVLKAIGYALFVCKIIVPLGLIIFGSIDFGKALMDSDDSAISKVSKTFMIKIIAAILIFVIPTIVNFVVRKADDTNDADTYKDCATCIFEPKNCK